MHSFSKKLASVFLSVLLLLLLIPAGLFAQAESAVMDEDELRAAVLAGGEITLGNSISMYIPLEITKDTVIHLGDNQLNTFEASGAEAPECAIILSGASLTLDGGNGGIYYSGTGSVFELVGAADKATTLTINGGSYSAMCNLDHATGEKSDCPQAAVKVVCDEGAVAPNVVVEDGSLMCESPSETEGSMEFKNPLLAGGDDCVIKGGYFYADPSAYVPEGYITVGDYEYQVLKVSSEMSPEFAAALNEDGKLVFDRYQPADDTDLSALLESIWEFLDEHMLAVHATTYDPAASTVYISRFDGETGLPLETHEVALEFHYDEELKAVVDGYIAKLPKGEETEWGYDYYYYAVEDMALINYWLSCTGEDEDINSFISFSDEFKKYIDYKNFKLDCRMGWYAPLSTGAAGFADFSVDGIVYGVAELGVEATHILYVPSDTATDKDSLLAAAKARLAAYLGEGHGVQLSYFGTALDVAFRYSYDMDLEAGFIDEDMTFDEYKQANAYIADEFDMYIGAEGVQADEPSFAAVIDGRTYYLLVRPDSDKMATPSFLNVDIATSVEVSTEAAAVPLDTLLQVDTVTGDSYEALIKLLPVDKGHAFDIKLYSSTMKEYVTKLENGTFAVKLPVPQELKGKDVIVYYVDADGKVTEHTATSDGDGYVSFVTDHFSVYTLAAKPVPAPAPHTHAPADKWSSDKTNHWKSCDCGDKVNEGAHTYGDWVLSAAKDTKTKTCSVCGYQLTEKADTLSTDPTPGSPATGETRHTVLWLVLVLGSAAVLVVLTVLNKKEPPKE